MNDNTHTGHRERVRRRVAGEGLRALEPHEVIEFLLCYALPRQDVNAVAHRLIERFGNVSGVLRASEKELREIDGIGERTAVILSRIGRTADACRRTDIEDRLSMRHYQAALSVLKDFKQYVCAPSSCLMCLDMDSRLLYRREITPSLSWGEPEVIRGALSDILGTKARCAVIALYGAEAVGPEDIVWARELSYILRECGTMLLDVVLLGENGAHSMRREGLIPENCDETEIKALCEDYLRDDK